MDRLIEDLNHSLHKGFINRKTFHQGNFVPKLLVNNKEENVLSTIINELHKCKSFTISVAFITESGLASLKSHLYDLNKKGIHGKILTSNYLAFNTPKMYKELLKLENVEVRLTNISGFHAKGYIFHHSQYSTLIIGSSNLTSNALKVNYEHNILLHSHENGELKHRLQGHFEALWSDSLPLTSEWITDYESTYQTNFSTKTLIPDEISLETQLKREITPNLMQVEALTALEQLRATGEKRALIISATGTGKTTLAALDVKAFMPKKFLFIVHNEGILRRAIEEFQKVFLYESKENFGLLTGIEKNNEAKYLFATIQTISKQYVYSQFSQNDFDYIVFDEAHRSTSDSYQKIFNYFEPAFMMGMTATPERNDDLDVFELFDYNIAYEIRLQKALESDILCPFHYFGVSDYFHNDQLIDDNFNDLSNLTSEERLQHVLKKTSYYGYSGETLKGLIFVSRKDEAYKLAEQLTNKGIPSTALTGEDSQSKRKEVISLLKDGILQYIITVDLFNEGVDIPEINQIVMLRSTQSSIIFIQQLGRGLRKSSNKEYVTVIDFIGNYKNNYLIPIALSGDQSQNKDNYKKFLSNPNGIYGISTINFEEVAKKRIYDSLNKIALNSINAIKEAYKTVESRIGRMPLLMDFVQQNAIAPSVIFSKYKNYHEFLKKSGFIKEDITENEFKCLTFLSRELTPGLKSTDHFILTELLTGTKTFDVLLEKAKKIDPQITGADIHTSFRILNLSFFASNIGKIYGVPLIKIDDKNISITEEFRHSLGKDIFKTYFIDLLELSKFNNEVRQKGQNRLLLYNKYSRKDFVKLLNWDSDEASTINGYKIKNNTLPIFITYHKQADISDNTNYKDEFLSSDELKWFTRSPRKLTSMEVQKIIHHKEDGITLYIFVKKEDSDGKDFYYLGNAQLIEDSPKEDVMPNGSSVVTMNFAMENIVREDVYRYLIGE